MAANKMNPTDALYGFVAWLTTRDETVSLGKDHSVAEISDLLIEYMRVNNLGGISCEYPHTIQMPKEK